MINTRLKTELHYFFFHFLGVAVTLFFLVSCNISQPTATESVSVTIVDVNNPIEAVVPFGSSVLDALQNAKIELGSLDRTDPPSFTLITEPLTITITRVREEFEQEEIVIPFERQTVKNENLPEGESLLVQPGENGIQQVTYRRLIENDVETSRSIFKVEIIKEAKPEILMIGIQSPFVPMEIPGKLAYLTAGNAWLIEKNTRQRRPIITTGDLDGRVFSLSPNGEWLLFTRKSNTENEINALWVINLNEENAQPIKLNVVNIIHFAEWVPNRTAIILYSTVEPRSTAPGWQANNDLRRLVFNASGRVVRDESVIETNAGGIYGWWGTSFHISPSANSIAYSRPDAVGVVDESEGGFNPLITILPFQTRSDWAWVPGVEWSPDGKLLFLVNHTPMSGINDPESSPLFDLSAYILPSGPLVKLVSQTGMFAYPSMSKGLIDNQARLAYLEAIFPDQSESSRYRLVVMQPDGSNRKVIFPPEGGTGLDPQKVVWSPVVSSTVQSFVGFIYQGNVWFISTEDWQPRQVTGDGLITRIDWK